MKFSIIVPTYNSVKWIEQCINSILSQSFNDFNLSIIDSGSTDGTVKWLRTLKDSRIAIYETDKRLSIEDNWARILTIPRNEFMTIMGHDDILYPDFLDEINRLVTINPDAGLYLTHFNFIDKDGKILRKCLPMKETINSEDLLKGILTNSIDLTATGFVMRSKDYDAIGGIPLYSNLLYADIELWFQLIKKSYLAVSKNTCFQFRFHPENTSKSFGQFRLDAFERSVDFLSKIKIEKNSYGNIIDELGKAFLLNHTKSACQKLIYSPKNKRDNISFDELISSSKRWAKKLLGTSDNFKPEHLKGIILAKVIDSNVILRKLFLFYKRFNRRLF